MNGLFSKIIQTFNEIFDSFVEVLMAFWRFEFINVFINNLNQWACDHKVLQFTFFDRNKLAYVTQYKCIVCGKVIMITTETGTAE